MRNLRDHGISFEDAKQVFTDQFYVVLTDRDAIGQVKSQTLILVAFIDETSDDSRLHFHIISARKADALEESYYAEQFQ